MNKKFERRDFYRNFLLLFLKEEKKINTNILRFVNCNDECQQDTPPINQNSFTMDFGQIQNNNFECKQGIECIVGDQITLRIGTAIQFSFNH